MKFLEDIEINGTKYKRILKIENGNIIWQKDMPKTPRTVHASGAHIIFSKPQQNHFDHYEAGAKWEEYCYL